MKKRLKKSPAKSAYLIVLEDMSREVPLGAERAFANPGSQCPAGITSMVVQLPKRTLCAQHGSSEEWSGLAELQESHQMHSLILSLLQQSVNPALKKTQYELSA